MEQKLIEEEILKLIKNELKHAYVSIYSNGTIDLVLNFEKKNKEYYIYFNKYLMPLFDNRIKFDASCNYIRVIAAVPNVTIRDIVNILQIDYNKIDFYQYKRFIYKYNLVQKNIGNFNFEFE